MTLVNVGLGKAPMPLMPTTPPRCAQARIDVVVPRYAEIRKRARIRVREDDGRR